MTLCFISRHTTPNYTALSTDIVGAKISGASIKRGTVYLTDLDEWRIIEADLTLGEYAITGHNTPVTIIAPLESNGAVPVNIQDQHSEIIDLVLHRDLGTATLASDISLGDKVIGVEAGHSIVAGNVLCIKSATSFYQGKVLSVATNDITLDSPLDYEYIVGSTTIHVGSDSLVVDGSTTPVEFHIQPPSGINWDVVRLNFHVEDKTVMDDGTFGGMTALTNGVVIQSRNGTRKNIFNVKTNGDFAERCQLREYVDKPPSGTGYAMNVHRVFGGQEQNGVTVRLVGEDADELVVIVQDNLLALEVLRVVAQGHVVTD